MYYGSNYLDIASTNQLYCQPSWWAYHVSAQAGAFFPGPSHNQTIVQAVSQQPLV